MYFQMIYIYWNALPHIVVGANLLFLRKAVPNVSLLLGRFINDEY